MMVFTVLFWAMTTFAQAEFAIPPNDAYVTDTAQVITEQQEEQLENTLRDYRESTSNEIALLIIPSLEGESEVDYAVETARKWGVGDSEKNNGVLILHIYNDRRVFISVGYGLEGVLPDIVINGILEEDMVPYFREGDYFAGYNAIIDSLQKHIGGEYTADRYQESSGTMENFAFFSVFLLQLVVAFLARTKSWWLGGVLGALIGLILVFTIGWWLAIPLFCVIGLILDYVVSKMSFSSGTNRRHRFGYPQSYYRGGRSSRGGFRGFGGGSSGGGGAGRSY